MTTNEGNPIGQLDQIELILFCFTRAGTWPSYVAAILRLGYALDQRKLGISYRACISQCELSMVRTFIQQYELVSEYIKPSNQKSYSPGEASIPVIWSHRMLPHLDSGEYSISSL